MKTTAAVVVTFERKKLLRENIRSLLAQTAADVLDIIVIDNASSDGTREYISDLIESRKIIYRNTGENLGGAGGFNFGIKLAEKLGYDNIWVMDDDCIPKKDALEEFLKWDRKLSGNYGFLSGRVFWKDGSICKMNVQKTSLTSYVKRSREPLERVIMASFVSLFLKADVVRDVGLPISDFFIWTDDWEYTRRISEKYDCYLVRTSKALHKSKNNKGADISLESPERLARYRYLYRNDVYLYRREGLKGFLYQSMRLPCHAARVLLKAPDKKAYRLRIIAEGTISGFGFHPETEFPKGECR